MVNKVILIGNVGKDPEVKKLENNIVAKFPLATTERYKDKNGTMQDQTEWHNIVVWGKLAELVEKHIIKGSQLYIEGKIRTNSYETQSGEKRYSTTIVANEIRFVGKKESEDKPKSKAKSNPEPPKDDNDDDLPF